MSYVYARDPGDLVAHYRVKRLLGQGAEGVVYLVTDMRNGSLRTLKILRGRDRVAEARHTVRYYRRLASCTSVKKLVDWGLLTGQRGVGDRPWLAFQYVEGRTLAQIADARRVRDPLQVLISVCAALAPVHQREMAIGDFDEARNLLVEKRTGLIRFCDLDAGVPGEPPPTKEDDMYELRRLGLKMYRAIGTTVPAAVRRALINSESASEAGRQLHRIGLQSLYLGSSDSPGSSSSRGSTRKAIASR